MDLCAIVVIFFLVFLSFFLFGTMQFEKKKKNNSPPAFLPVTCGEILSSLPPAPTPQLQ